MRDDITSIPVSEVFEPKDGCPMCRLRDMLEERVTTYIMGAAMMEPDVRIETNKTGFCFDHYQMMLKKRNRLSIALTMQTHLAELETQVFGGVFGKSPKQQVQTLDKQAHSCFVCDKVNTSMTRLTATVCRLWEQEEDFQKLFAEQPMLCLPHYAQLTDTASRAMSKRNGAAFSKVCATIARGYMTELSGDVDHFCRMFDYRNTGGDFGNAKDAIERAVWFLTGRQPK